MPDASWPIGLRSGGAFGVSGGPQSNIDSFQPEIGPSISRRKSTYAVRSYQVELTMINSAERDLFLTFFHTTLRDGNLPFLWVDPMKGKTGLYFTQRCKFVPLSEQETYNDQRLTKESFNIRFKVMLL